MTDLSDDDIEKIPSNDRCKLLKNNPVLVARRFQYRVEEFFKNIIMDGPLGKMKYYIICTEFQVCVSPHV